MTPTHILFDDHRHAALYPFTRTRPTGMVRCGILTAAERWEALTGRAPGFLTPTYMQEVFPTLAGADNVYINGAVHADAALRDAIAALKPQHKLTAGQLTIAARLHTAPQTPDELAAAMQPLTEVPYGGNVLALNHIWDIFSFNDALLRSDFALITAGRKSAPVPPHVVAMGDNLFIEEGAHIYPGCIINAAKGPVYIGHDTEILEGVLMQGPIAVCDHAVVKMGAKIYGGTTIGPGCKVGGEISNVVFFANSNKGHDGYLGNAVIGEWCNLGADTNSSNLKNNYDTIKVWDEQADALVRTGLTFCGLLMGDHSKCGINTMFNTGTVVGVSANIYGGGFPDKFIPSFGWGGAEGMVTYDFDKAIETANRMMARRGRGLSPAEVQMFQYLFDRTAAQRAAFNHA